MYKVISALTAAALEDRMHTFIKAGCNPVGGVSLTIANGKELWIQAIIMPIELYNEIHDV